MSIECKWDSTRMMSWESEHGTLALFKGSAQNTKYPSLYFKNKEDNCYIKVAGPVIRPELLLEFFGGKRDE